MADPKTGDTLTIAIAQLNPLVGDLDGNVDKIREARGQAGARSADLVVATELVVSGYPPEDLVLKPSFVAAVASRIDTLAAETSDGGPGLIVGAPWQEGGAAHPGRPYNAILLLDGGKIAAVGEKAELPNYGVFDEARVFRPGIPADPVPFRGITLGLCICEDIWVPGICADLKARGAELLVVINASPFEHDKPGQRRAIAADRVRETGLPILYVNQVGGQDELVFDGGSFVLNRDGKLAVAAPSFVENIALSTWARGPDGALVCTQGDIAPAPEGLPAMYDAMILGLHDYVAKNGFPGVVLGLSGGIDSALTAVVAVDALGPASVRAVFMPSPFTSPESLEDATECAKRLGIRLDTMAIDPAMAAFDGMLQTGLGEAPAGVTAENIQARSRGLALMAVSNQTGAMLLTTGNKSEMSVGYATIYGDMNGGFSVLKDIYKTDVFALARWRNEALPDLFFDVESTVPTPIPQRIIDKPPSAELRPGQKDEDSLPPYDELDRMLKALIEEDMGVEDLIARGHDAKEAAGIWRMLELAEYKRRQAPPGVKITARAFGRDRRYPITNAYRTRP
ncbi:MAG: NAD+ synthase [Alphaproteobacteria bacterium]|nr:NAD+ synthase [Alphaproteobacteria bacterium]